MSVMLRVRNAKFLEKHSWLWFLVRRLELDQRKDGKDAELRK
jgi:hypothetical protein